MDNGDLCVKTITVHTGGRNFELNMHRCAHTRMSLHKKRRVLKTRPITFNFEFPKLRTAPFVIYIDNYCKLFICILMEFLLGRR